MFFKSKPNEHDREKAVQIVSEYFNLPERQVDAWCKTKDAQLQIELPFACSTLWEDIQSRLQTQGLQAVELHTNIAPKSTKTPRLPRVKNLLAVASGKGGVGKSATSVNLAFALMQEGAKVGLLDADIYGPSIPIMLGNPEEHPGSEDQKHMFPLEAYGLVANSIGYLVPAENATIWRGPMVSRALQQLVTDTLWPELDYLVVDLPPGTGDIQLTLAQQVPVTAAVVVTTPQDLALADATKGIAMFDKVEIPVLGLIENMSFYQCQQCGHKEHIFASGGGEHLANQHGVEVLANLPLDMKIRTHADGGKPLLLEEPEGEIAIEYRKAARNLSMKLAMHQQISEDLSIQIVEKN